MNSTITRRLRRGAAVAVATIVLVAGGVVAGAAPAQAAGTYRVYLKTQVIDGYKKSSILRGSGSRGDTLKVGFAYYGDPNRGPKPKVTLQRKIGSGAWKTIKKATQTSKFYLAAKLPAYTVPAGVVSQKVAYRFKSTKSASRNVVNTDYSPTYRVTYENQSMYTGFQATVYQYLAPYCPTVAVHLDASIAAYDHAGEFVWTRGITIDPGLETSVAGSPNGAAYIQSVALHECAHFKQFQNFGASYTGTRNAERASDAIFVQDVNPATETDPEMTYPYASPFDAYEHAADCASHSVQPLGYLGYGGYCSPTELAAANRLLVGSSKY